MSGDVVNTHKSELERELEASEDELDPDRRLEILEQLAWLDDLAAEYKADQDGPRRIASQEKQRKLIAQEETSNHDKGDDSVVHDDAFDLFRDTVEEIFQRDFSGREKQVSKEPDQVASMNAKSQSDDVADHDEVSTEQLLFGKNLPQFLTENRLEQTRIDQDRERVDDDVGKDRGR